MYLVMTPTPCDLDKNNINYFIWGINYWINGSYTCYKIYPNKERQNGKIQIYRSLQRYKQKVCKTSQYRFGLRPSKDHF